MADDGSPSRFADDEPAALDLVVYVAIRKAEADQIANSVKGLRGRRLHCSVSTMDVDGDHHRIVAIGLVPTIPQTAEKLQAAATGARWVTFAPLSGMTARTANSSKALTMYAE